MKPSHFQLLMKLSLAVLFVTPCSAPALLTKAQALSIMQKNGIRWQQTHLVVEDAKNLSQIADAALKPHAQIVGKELISKADLSRFGIQSSGPDNIISYGAIVAEFDVPLLDRKSLSRSQAAGANIEIGEEQSAQYRSELTAGMVLTYLNAQRFAEKMRVIKQNIDRDGEIVKMAEAKVRSGTGISMDLLRAQGLVAFEKMKLIDTETSYRKAVQDLATLLGQPTITEDLEPFTLKIISIDVDDPFAKTGIDDRADVKISLQTLRAARLIREQAQNEWFPTISLFGEAGVGASSVFPNSGPNAVGVLGLQIKAPIFDGGYLTGKERQAQTDITKAELQAKHVRLEANAQIKEALEQLKTAKAAASLAVEQVDLATKELDIARHRFESGAASGADLAISQAGLSTVFAAQIDITAGYEAAKINYFKSTGDLDSYFKSEAPLK